MKERYKSRDIFVMPKSMEMAANKYKIREINPSINAAQPIVRQIELWYEWSTGVISFLYEPRHVY